MPILLDYKQLEKLKQKRKARKMKRQRDNISMERTLKKSMDKLWKEVLLPASEEIRDMIKRKAPASDIAELMDRVLRKAEFEYGLASDEFITEWQLSVDRQTRTEMLKGLQESLGVDMTAFYDTPEIKDVLESSTLEMSQLIKTIPNDYLSDVARAVNDNFTGRPLPENRTLLQQVQHLGKVTKNRSKVIARDQTKKLSSALNRHRQESIGVEMYIWRTVKDERVVGKPGGRYPKGNKAHGNHWMMDGKYCRWDDPTVYSTDKGKTWKKRKSDMPKNNPGDDILCRCHAEPVIDIQQIIKFAEAA